jgi:hypothetical protein
MTSDSEERKPSDTTSNRDDGGPRGGSEHVRLSHHAVMAEHALDTFPPDTEARFLGDPEHWLPGRLTMHGAKTFQARMRLLGAAMNLEFRVGMAWTRGETTTRRFRVEFLDPPFLLTWMLPTVDGELVLMPGRQQGIVLRFEGATKTWGLLRGRRLLAPRVMRTIVGAIASRLSTSTPPTSTSRR